MGYHFFKRRVYSEIGKPIDESELDRGLHILGSILRFGLLLKPDDGTGARSPTPQICFTEMTQERLFKPEILIDGTLRSHSDIFGPFAIGIDHDLARKLGLSPVLYKAGPVPEKLSCCLKQVYNTLAVLAHIESLAHPDHDAHAKNGHALPRGRLAKFGVDLRTKNDDHRDNALVALERLKGSAKDVEDIFEALDPDRLPFWHMTNLITLLIDLEQDANSTINNRHLAYYRQQEWRIQRTFLKGVGIVPLSADEIEIFGAVCNEDIEYRTAFNDYWAEVDYQVGPNEWLMVDVETDPKVRRRRICEIINEIVYPRKYDKDVRDMIKNLESDGDQINAKLTPIPDWPQK